MFDTNMTNDKLPQLYFALNPQSNNNRMKEMASPYGCTENGGPKQSTYMGTLSAWNGNMSKNSWVHGSESKWSKTASRPKLSKLVECGLEWSQMVQYDRNSPNGPKQSKLVQSGLKWRVHNGPKQSKRSKNGPKRSLWSKMDQNGPKRP